MQSNGTEKTNANNGYNSLWRNFLNGNSYLAMMASVSRNVLADDSATKP